MNKQLQESVRFLIVILLTFVLLYGVVSYQIGFKPLTDLTAKATIVGLESLGTNVTMLPSDEQTLLEVQGRIILISELCTGWFEIALLIAAMIATLHATRRQKGIGIILALVGGFLVNQIRVIASIQQVVHTSIDWANFTHDVLFRISMFVVVLGMYAVWLKWVNEKKSEKKKKAKK